MTDDRQLFLIDGTALAYRAHFALGRAGLRTPGGRPTGAVYGFIRMLRALLRAEDPARVAVALDPRTPTFRHGLYPEYKATRQKMPDELREQLPVIRDFLTAAGIPVLEVDGFEADDVIGTLAARGAREGFRSVLVTGDKDFMQLVDGGIRLYDPTRPGDEAWSGPEEVRRRFGVGPDRVTDILGLMGDASDNIPGVPGVGEKTAAELVQTFGSLEGALDRAEDVKRGKIRDALIAHRDQALLSKRLATIRTDVPLDVGPADLLRRPEDRPRLVALFRELDFRTLVAEMEGTAAPEAGEVPAGSAPAPAPAPAGDLAPENARAIRDYITVEDAGALEALRTRIETAELVVVDTETDSLEARHARAVGLSFSFEPGRAYYVPLNRTPPVVPDPGGNAGPPGAGVLAILGPALTAPGRRLAGQNCKYDIAVLRNHGVDVPGLAFDTMLASYLLEPEDRSHGLDALTEKHLGLPKIRTEELIGKGAGTITMADVPIPRVAEYACEDADYTRRLVDCFRPRIAELGLASILEDIELPLVLVLESMEREGVRVDTARLAALETRLRRELDHIADGIIEAAGRPFNVNSPAQVAQILYEELRVHEGTGVRIRRTKSGLSTDQEMLEDLAPHHPLPRRVLEYRKIQKLLSTWVAQLPGFVDPSTGRIHTSYNQAVAATGRLSSSRPNLQNIPIRTPLGREIRAAFLASAKGRVLASADYSQVELRIMAHVSGDPALIAAFREGRDIHRDTAARIFEVPPERVDAGMRNRAKAINFGIMYGMGRDRLARETGMKRDEAQAFIDRYFATYPRVREFLDDTKERARADGFVTTLLGRRRPIPDMASRNGQLRAAAENMAVNTPIQGTAADLIKTAMVRIHARLRAGRLDARMILQVHDELVFDAPAAEVPELLALVRTEMEGALSLSVPLRVDTGVGADWLEAHA